MSTHDDFRSCDTMPRRFGLCYHCLDGAHTECFGVPCDCACPTRQRPAPAESEYQRGVQDGMRQERELRTAGGKIRIPTDVMEQEFATYERRGYQRGVREERARWTELRRGIDDAWMQAVVSTVGYETASALRDEVVRTRSQDAAAQDDRGEGE